MSREDAMRVFAWCAIAICIGTWVMDLLEWVYPCPYCRTQRTAIGLLGLMMLAPFAQAFPVRLAGTVVGLLGLVVAAMQNFNHWKKIWAGTFELGEQWYIHPFLLSGAAMFILAAQLMLLLGMTMQMQGTDRRDLAGAT